MLLGTGANVMIVTEIQNRSGTTDAPLGAFLSLAIFMSLRSEGNCVILWVSWVVKFLLMKPIKDMVQAAVEDIPTVLRFFFCSFIYLSQTEHVPCVILSTQPVENLFSLSRTWFIFFISNSVFLIAFFRQTQDDINFKRISLRWNIT